MINSFSKGPESQSNTPDPRPEDIDMLTKLSADIASLSRLIKEMKSRGEETAEQEKKLLALESVYSRELTAARESVVKHNEETEIRHENDDDGVDAFTGTREGYASDKARRARENYEKFLKGNN